MLQHTSHYPLLSTSFHPRLSPGAQVEQIRPGAWRLEIPPGSASSYRLAQLDDYSDLPRRKLPWRAPLHFEVSARASATDLPGTWGLGLWNDPFSLSLGFGGGNRRFPTLPNAAWFFFASPCNYLSLRDDLPAHGILAAAFQATNPLGNTLALFAAPMLLIKPLRRLARRLGRRYVNEAACLLSHDPGVWHAYRIDWLPGETLFYVDGTLMLQSPVSPRDPLGIVIWIDNQFAAFTPDGDLRYGFEANPSPARIEIKDLMLR